MNFKDLAFRIVIIVLAFNFGTQAKSMKQCIKDLHYATIETDIVCGIQNKESFFMNLWEAQCWKRYK